ncbi:hypothetical protein H5S40_05310 [Limosilactobacillus sp. RRLNB_1_1]|uniref:Uncharacterized protein n=1 Tax=Limosilactobacillus albertensis TaxID=2759752 RepID=A0A7W3TRI2_9LACO|nr:hypothetical protein [Limosilactobacillus albertensis]MBB1069575.1 hypothetical protein [Limosilactobacillus albertensis]MCD7118101.1 hypothetical protein [Limosilactobacillus albertensis]MCD7127645.1 hypothetical protein [Limosilactobacillus albertensis]
MNEQEQHIDQFLTSSNYHQLSANQQKHAQDILTRFNNQMANDQHLTDTTWTPEAVKAVMVGEFIADPSLTNQFGIAVVPVLRAYQEFLKVDNLAEVVKAMEEQRTKMNECRKAHKTWAQLHGDEEREEESVPVQETPAKEKVTWTPEKFKDLLANIQQAIKTDPHFNNLELDNVELNYVVQEFLELMVQECAEYPDQWTFSNLQRVLGMMMPLDPHISIKQIHNIVPSAQALFEYMKQNDYIDMDQYRLGLKAIANMQPSEDMLASLNRDERETQLVLSFINSNGIDTDDADVAEAWMDDHKQEVADFMRGLLNPWGEYERKRLIKRQREMQQKQQQQMAVSDHTDPQLKRKKKSLQGIKFSKKARRKLRRR